MSEVPEAERELLAGAERRLGVFILFLVPLGAAVVGWRWGGKIAASFTFGGVLAYLNYRWIVAVVDTLMGAQKAEVPRRTYLKLGLPLVLLVLILYVIFSRSWLSVPGVLGGLFLLVLAVLLEGVYQVCLSARQ